MMNNVNVIAQTIDVSISAPMPVAAVLSALGMLESPQWVISPLSGEILSVEDYILSSGDTVIVEDNKECPLILHCV